MRVTVRYFATLRESLGRETESLDLPQGTTVAEAYRRAGGPAALRVGYAVNEAFVSPSTVLEEGDEVAFLPPLGGG